MQSVGANHPGDRRERKSAPRPITIGDAMVLIAATALAVARNYAGAVLQFELRPLPPIPRKYLAVYRHLVAVLPFPLAWSLAVFVLGLCHPRPSSRRLARRPGFVACGAVSVVIIIRIVGFLTLLGRMVLKGSTTLGLEIWEALTVPFHVLAKGWITVLANYAGPYFSTTAFGASAATAVAWLLLIASGRWRSEPHWLDRLGRVLGWFWIGIIPFSCWWDYNVLW
jgi:hypothetical protein